MRYIYVMEYYSAIKMNEILPFLTPWMDLKGIILSKMSQMEKSNITWPHFMWNLKNRKKITKITKTKFRDTENWLVAARSKAGSWEDEEGGKNGWRDSKGMNSVIK